MANPFHPELRRAARWLPRFSFGPRLTRLVQWLQRRRGVPAPPERDDLTIRDVFTAAPDGHRLRIRTFIPSADRSRGAGMVWIHGGGFIIGSPEQDQDGLIALCRDLGLTIAAVSYRLAPAHPHPTPVEDCYAALRTDTDERRLRLWSAKSNRYAWGAYLGRPPGGDGVSDHAAPARRENLSGLPPAWIGVGTCDLFHDEDLEYARRLQEAGVPCELHVVEGGFHGFDLVKEASVSQTFRQSYTAALRRGLGIA
jgi:acetyl esterase/lipase